MEGMVHYDLFSTGLLLYLFALGKCTCSLISWCELSCILHHMHVTPMHNDGLLCLCSSIPSLYIFSSFQTLHGRFWGSVKSTETRALLELILLDAIRVKSQIQLTNCTVLCLQQPERRASIAHFMQERLRVQSKWRRCGNGVISSLSSPYFGSCISAHESGMCVLWQNLEEAIRHPIRRCVEEHNL